VSRTVALCAEMSLSLKISEQIWVVDFSILECIFTIILLPNSCNISRVNSLNIYRNDLNACNLRSMFYSLRASISG